MWYDRTYERHRSEGAIVPYFPVVGDTVARQLACPYVTIIPVVGVTDQLGRLVP